MLIKDTIKVLKHESSKWWTFFPQNFFSWYSSLTLLDKPDFRDLITYAFIFFFFFFFDLFSCCGIFYLFLDRTNRTKRVKKKRKKKFSNVKAAYWYGWNCSKQKADGSPYFVISLAFYWSNSHNIRISFTTFFCYSYILTRVNISILISL